MASPSRIATLAALPLALLAGLGVFWALGGFPSAPSTSAVSATAAPLDQDTAAVCRALVARLPTSLGGLDRRPVTAGGEQNAAFGDPPIVLSCGVPVRSIPQNAQLLALSNVCWYPEERSTETVWQSVDRKVSLQVVVPKKAEGSWVVNLSAPIVATVPQTASPGPVHC
ncbi:DUF3515 family protein [Dactylosporangium sucinum]|uniref:DUF3515 domain-containing protein n=1 Tax=Dactylosporangium sucinum TaxID=1424081 RepID=A0A917TE06_9ACTN|nr:DUF3515 family protein [Dactylosporangium sucinum]GGM20022.1 hypothetical protein GCM10007977_021590 [Dactylosporangium sucinum]